LKKFATRLRVFPLQILDVVVPIGGDDCESDDRKSRMVEISFAFETEPIHEINKMLQLRDRREHLLC